mmetsp:Transcript_19521/g.39545  ORF Transcript_19521/g.39545 Transcript_19521/m.39545 type:complete len:451 (+) Transcript_19521:309-1661(+)
MNTNRCIRTQIHCETTSLTYLIPRRNGAVPAIIATSLAAFLRLLPRPSWGLCIVFTPIVIATKIVVIVKIKRSVVITSAAASRLVKVWSIKLIITIFVYPTVTTLFRRTAKSARILPAVWVAILIFTPVFFHPRVVVRRRWTSWPTRVFPTVWVIILIIAPRTVIIVRAARTTRPSRVLPAVGIIVLNITPVVVRNTIAGPDARPSTPCARRIIPAIRVIVPIVPSIVAFTHVAETHTSTWTPWLKIFPAVGTIVLGWSVVTHVLILAKVAETHTGTRSSPSPPTSHRRVAVGPVQAIIVSAIAASSQWPASARPSRTEIWITTIWAVIVAVIVLPSRQQPVEPKAAVVSVPHVIISRLGPIPLDQTRAKRPRSNRLKRVQCLVTPSPLLGLPEPIFRLGDITFVCVGSLFRCCRLGLGIRETLLGVLQPTVGGFNSLFGKRFVFLLLGR